MRKKEFEQLRAKERYEALCVLAKVMMGRCEDLASIRNKSIQETAVYNKLLSYDTVTVQIMKNVIDDQQQLEKSTIHLKEMIRLNKTEHSIMKDIKKYEKKMCDFLIIFFDLKSLKINGFNFSVSVAADTIHLYPYKGKSVADDAKHGHYGIVIGQRRVFRRAYGAYKYNGAERKKKGQNKKDVTETFNLGTFLELMTLKSAKSAK